MIEADLKKVGKRFEARIDWDNLEKAFKLREHYKSASMPSALDSFVIQSAETPQQKRLATMAKDHYAAEIQKLAVKLKKYEQDVKDFEEKIKKGSKAKTIHENLRKRRETVKKHKDKIESYKKIDESGISRIFPMYYAPVVVKDGKDNMIRFMRYQLCPKNGKELDPYKYSLFNARKDRLMDSKIWLAVFGKQHGIFPFYRFYENVEGENGKSKTIYFQPDHGDIMWSAALFETAKIKEGELWSFAAITNDPPPEVAAAGHDRCPVYIEESKFEDWLNPAKIKKEDLLKLLSAIEKTYFEHKAA